MASSTCQTVAEITSGPRFGPYPASSVPMTYSMASLSSAEGCLRFVLESYDAGSTLLSAAATQDRRFLVFLQEAHG